MSLRSCHHPKLAAPGEDVLFLFKRVCEAYFRGKLALQRTTNQPLGLCTRVYSNRSNRRLHVLMCHLVAFGCLAWGFILLVFFLVGTPFDVALKRDPKGTPPCCNPWEHPFPNSFRLELVAATANILSEVEATGAVSLHLRGGLCVTTLEE